MNNRHDIDKSLQSLKEAQPIGVKFLGKVRRVHWFHRGTAERFAEALKQKAVTKTARRKVQRQLLSIVLSDLWQSPRLFRGVRRLCWAVRLAFTSYSQPEAVALIDAAGVRIQQEKQLDMLTVLTINEIWQKLKACDEINRQQLTGEEANNG